MKFWNKKSVLTGILLLALFGGATVFVLLREFRDGAVWSALLHADLHWIAVGVFLMGCYLACEAANIRSALKSAGYRPKFGQTFCYAIAGFFFSSITPSASGGQPAQLFLMHRDGIRLSHGSFSLLCELIGFQIGTVLWGIIGFVTVFQSDLLPFGNGVIYVFAVGFLINIFTLCLLLCVLFSETLSRFFAAILFWGARLWRRDGSKPKILRAVAEYRFAAKKLRNDPRTVLKIVLTSVLRLTVYHSMIYICSQALNIGNISWFCGASLSGMLFACVSALPLPGAAGASEGGYALLFGTLLPKSSVGSLLIATRALQFVLPLVFTGIAAALLFPKHLKTKKGL